MFAYPPKLLVSWRDDVSCVGGCAWRKVRYCLLFLATMLSGWAPSGWAESAREELLKKEPLAVCAVQSLSSGTAQPEGAGNLVPRARRPVSEDPLSGYARQIDGQWYIPRTVDREDPWIRLLVLSPERPALVDLAILVDGKPYREAREQWIDLLLEQAKKESLVKDALAVLTEDPSARSGNSAPSEEEINAEANAETNAEATQEKADEKTDEDAGEGALADGPDKKRPGIKVRSRKAPTLVKRLINYLATGGVQEDREEIRWLLSEWAGGPALLAMGPASSWQRAKVAPLWNFLDRDRDQILSAAEVRQASERLRQADLDEDDVVDLEELNQIGEQQSPYPRAMNHPLVVVLHEGTAWDALHGHLVTLYGRDAPETSAQASSKSSLKARIRQGDASLSSSELAQLLYAPPDLSARMELGEQEGQVALLAAEDASEASAPQVISASAQVITIRQKNTYLELTAASGQAQSELDLRQTQIAVGAIMDGYPLFRQLDRDGNRRLTLREQRRLKDCLAECDLNGDGQLDSHEIPTAIRLTVTHGAHAAEHLRSPTRASYALGSMGDRKTALAWFTQMDRNRDGDLSLSEFLGTPEQFQQFDRDSDGLISNEESQTQEKGGRDE